MSLLHDGQQKYVRYIKSIVLEEGSTQKSLPFSWLTEQFYWQLKSWYYINQYGWTRNVDMFEYTHDGI